MTRQELLKKKNDGWAKIGAAAQRRSAAGAHQGRKPLSPEVLGFLRDGVVGDKPIAKPKDWVALRPSKEDLLDH